MKVQVPPIKCQGIKTKLVPTILRNIEREADGLWIEPFLGSGVVALNAVPKRALLADSNPHIIRFYQAVKDGMIDGATTREFLEREGRKLSAQRQDYYYQVRERFNSGGDPLDFLFLNRSCFNGVIRFNRRGKFNVPFGHKPQRFAPAYITKIVNQVNYFQAATRLFDWNFVCQDFQSTIRQAAVNDFLYCDPPYVGRHTDYYNDWDEHSENSLFSELKGTRSRFMLSTWHSNQHRENDFLRTLWSEFTVVTREHFYHVGARESNRKPMLEALVMNYTPPSPHQPTGKSAEQLALLERNREYLTSNLE